MMFVDQLCHLRSISPLMGFESLTGLTLQVEPLAQFTKSAEIHLSERAGCQIQYLVKILENLLQRPNIND